MERGREPGRPRGGGGDGEGGRVRRGPRGDGGAIQAHGGIGFTWEADVHWLFKRAQIDAVLLGGAGRHRARVAAILAERFAASPAA